MTEFLQNLDLLGKIYLAAAFFGTLLFFVQVVLQFISGIDADADLASDTGTDTIAPHHGSPDLAFKFLSFQGISAFLMIFGLVGLALLTSAKTSNLVSIIGACIAGYLALLLISKLFKMMGKLQSTGNFDYSLLKGKTAKVYVAVKNNQPGQIQVIANNRQIFIDAIASEGNLEIASGEMVTIKEVIGSNLVKVQKA